MSRRIELLAFLAIAILAGLVAMFASSQTANAASPCAPLSFRGASYIVCTVDLRTYLVRLFWKDSQQQPYGTGHGDHHALLWSPPRALWRYPIGLSPDAVIGCTSWWGKCGKGGDIIAGRLGSDRCMCVIKPEGVECERAHCENDSHPLLGLGSAGGRVQ
jgi:hypothetical protein